MAAQLGDQRVEGGVVAQRAVHQHQRRPVAVGPDGERRPVGRPDVERRVPTSVAVIAARPGTRADAGDQLGGEDVGDVPLAVEDPDAGVGQRGGHGRDVGRERVVAVRAGQQQGRHGDPRRLPGVEGHLGMARSSRTIVGAAATRAGHAGCARRAVISASGISTTSRNIVSTTASRSPRPAARPAARRRPGSSRARGRRAATLVEDEPPDVGGQRRPAERAQPAEGVAVQVDRGPGGLRDRVDHGGDVLELARQVVAGRVAAGAAAAPVQGVDGACGSR